MSSTPIVDFLTKQIFIERNVVSSSWLDEGTNCHFHKVTYRSLSRELRLHVNTAKNELAVYHENAPYRSQISYATYLVCGEIDPPDVDDMNMDYGEGTDAERDLEDDGDDVPQTKLLLVNEPDLDDAKSQFTRINSIHIYSLSPSQLRDSGHVCTPTDLVRTADRGKDAKEMIKITGKVVGANIKTVQSTSKTAKPTRQPVAGPSRSKPSRSASAEAKEKESSAEPKERNKITDKLKERPKATGKLDFSKATLKEKKSDTSTEPAKGKKDKVREESRESKVKEKEKESVPVKAQQSKKMTEPAKRGTKRKSALGLSGSEEETDGPSNAVSRHASPLPNAKENVRVKGRALISDEEEDEVTKPVRKQRKGRIAAAAAESDNEEVLAMMDIDDDQVTHVSRESKGGRAADKEQGEEYEEEEEKPAAVDEDVDMDLPMDLPKAKAKKRAPKKVIPVGKNGLKKRRVIKSRSSVDDKGYMVFEDYSEYESVDEEEEPGPARAKAKAKAKTEEEGDDGSAPAAKSKVKTAVQKEPPKAKGTKAGGTKDSELLLEEEEVDKETEAFEMVQTYGAVRPPAYDESEPGPSSGSEQSALLGGERDTSVKRVVQHDGHASLTSCISNLANTIMGTGAYLIIVKGLMPNVVQSFYHALTPPTTLPPPWMLNGANWITIFMVVIGPLAFLRRLDSLRHTSYIALFSVGKWIWLLDQLCASIGFDSVGANIVAMYPQTSLFIALGQVAIVISVLSSYALQVHPCRNCLDKVLQYGQHVATEGDEEVDKDHAGSDMTALRHTLLTSVIIGGGFTIAYFVDDLKMGKCVCVAGRGR
ncbi:hypothetical protein C0992_001589 [Termitomyces sp. T32_za158]|nr:hypothetical protein C0992_001589 [Termitomyces sp. T32_za158]